MNGKEMCSRLWEIRKAICLENDIPFTEEECTSSGEGCIGTCPKCDHELKILSDKLSERQRRGLPVTFANASALYETLQAAASARKSGG